MTGGTCGENDCGYGSARCRAASVYQMAHYDSTLNTDNGWKDILGEAFVCVCVMWTNWEPRMDMESQKRRNHGAAPKHLRMKSAWSHTPTDNNRKETDLWPPLNLPQVFVGGLNDLTYSLVSSRHWNLSRRILFTENLRLFSGIGHKKKGAGMKNSYRACLFSVKQAQG